METNQPNPTEATPKKGGFFKAILTLAILGGISYYSYNYITGLDAQVKEAEAKKATADSLHTDSVSKATALIATKAKADSVAKSDSTKTK